MLPPTIDRRTAMPTYTGSCHCGRVRFELDAILTTVDDCNCTLCRRRGALIYYAEEHQFRLLTPLEECTVYQWNTKTAVDYFCPVCGMLGFRRPRDRNHMWGVNVRCLEGVDLDALVVEKDDEGNKMSVVE